VIAFFLLFHPTSINGQTENFDESQPPNLSDGINKERLKWMLGIGAGTYIGGSYVLYQSWYKDFPRSSFHFFNDFLEWQQVDKAGHIYSSYAQARLISQGFRWTGLDIEKSNQYAMWSSLLFQTTVEVMDGFSSEWGFSWSDMGANIIGLGVYGLQEALWQEQRISIKFSSFPKSYPSAAQSSAGLINLQDRTNDLYGTHLLERILKDYNSSTYWASVNVRSFITESALPYWLNIAVGYGSDNLYGGFDNHWMQDGRTITLDLTAYPRIRQYYLSLDIDTSRIKTNSKFLRTLLDIVNLIKVPLPTFEYNSANEFKFHPLKF
jgi:hypothetical protein